MSETRRRKSVVDVGIWILVLFVLGAACSDASLYGGPGGDPSANRLALTGRVCTDDAKDKGFPVRVIFLVDTAAGNLFSTYDLESLRLQALRDALALHGGNESYQFAIAAMDGRARRLAPTEGYFTRNPGELENAVALTALPQGCIAGVCRDYSAGLELVQSIVEGDLASLKPGEKSRTQYTVILMAGGPPDPLKCASDCCDCADDDCDCNTCDLSFSCTQELLRTEITDLREKVEKEGAAAFSLHVLHLEGNGSDENTAAMLKDAAFAGNGRYEKFNSADSITLDRIGLSRVSSLFQIKTLMATNANVLPNAENPIVDSDGDGIGDGEELDMGTNPLAKDTDGDGIGDYIEWLISFDPLVVDADIPLCVTLEGPPFRDEDGDRLNDCEELLLGTEPTLPDTDGDGIIDWVEVVLGTDYLLPDSLKDPDRDGSDNWEECRQHTDPRSGDAASHLGNAYRYDLEEPYFTKEPVVTSPRRILGVTALSAGEDSTGGLGTLRYLRNPSRLSWQDASDDAAGTPVDVSASGVYTLNSAAQAVDAPEKWISVSVDNRMYPPDNEQEFLLVEIAEKQCLSFTISNIRLMETLQPEGRGGLNDVFLYFAESPKDRLTLPGLFRVLHIPVVYHEEKGRVPDDVYLEIKDEELSSIGF